MNNTGHERPYTIFDWIVQPTYYYSALNYVPSLRAYLGNMMKRKPEDPFDAPKLAARF